ncbi:MAG: high-affinity nickel-transporter, partial [Chloroflexi bacterium]|nr:high-affinity nickel-transporter [Chloroflexota bacterium]
VRSSTGAHQLDYRDDNFAERLGWREIVVRADGAQLTRSSVPTGDRSSELTTYPDDMLSSPLDVREAHATFEYNAATSSAPASETSAVPTSIIDRSRDQLVELIAVEDLSVPVMLLALAAALGLGALHALSPGHGKTVVGAYLVGSRGTARHALFLGLTVTLTHTLGVFALGLITLFASQFILPETLYPWLSLISGAMVVLIGLSLFVTRARTFLHGHVHAHDHTHGHGDHEHGHGHTHLPADANAPITWRSLLALGVSGGLLPCPSALVVLLGAISLHRVGFGLLLIVAFSAGLAGVLTAIGVLLVYAGRIFNRVRAPGRLILLLPVGSALVVTLLGVVIAAQALVQVGVVPSIDFPALVILSQRR